jgi:predicted O-methyltransferase YrrM
MSHLKDTHSVLEFGSGTSTFEIANKVKKIISIEHQKKWYDSLILESPENCTLILKEPNLPYVEGLSCGTYDEFKDYIESPIEYGPFDIILIDGRARVSCSSICKLLSHENTIIFIHDFHRPEYQEALKYLELIDSVKTMSKFKLKK